MQERAEAANLYAQPFALTDQFKSVRGSDDGDDDDGEGEESGQAAAGTKSASVRFVADLNVRLSCTNCRAEPLHLVEEFASGDVVCGECGLVVGDKIIDTRSEWRTFANDEGDDPSRVGSSSDPLMEGLEAQLETRIGTRDGGTDTARDLHRSMMRRPAGSSRVILDAFKDIQSKCDQIQLPHSVADTAKLMFKQVEQDQILRGKHREAIAVAVIYCACKANRVPRTFAELCQLSRENPELIGRCFYKMQAAYGYTMLRAPPDSGAASGIRATSAVDLVPRFCNRLALAAKASIVTEEVTKSLHDKGILAGRKPTTVAATCIYVVARMLGQSVSTEEISAVAGVSDVTIRGASRDLMSRRSEWLTPAIMTRYPELDDTRLQ